MILSVSSVLSEEETQTQDLSFGSQIFKDGFIELSGSRTSYESDDDDEDSEVSNSGGLSYGHDLSRYLSVSIEGYKSVESEYLKSTENELSMKIRVNSLWKSYYLTSISLGRGAKKHTYYRELKNASNDLELDFEEKYSYIGLLQELSDFVSVRYRYTKYEYAEDPNTIPNKKPVILSLLPDLESLLYGFLDTSQSFGISIFYKKVSLYFSHNLIVTNIEKETEKANTVNLGYSFKSFDLTLIRSESILDDGAIKSSGIEIGYFF